MGKLLRFVRPKGSDVISAATTAPQEGRTGMSVCTKCVKPVDTETFLANDHLCAECSVAVQPKKKRVTKRIG